MRNLAFIAICLVVFCIPWQEMAIFSEVLSVSFVLGGLTIFLSALAVVMNLRIRKLPPAFPRRAHHRLLQFRLSSPNDSSRDARGSRNDRKATASPGQAFRGNHQSPPTFIENLAQSAESCFDTSQGIHPAKKIHQGCLKWNNYLLTDSKRPAWR